MTPLTRVCRAVGVGIAVTTATLAMTQVAHAQLPPPKIQPGQAAIQAPPANVVFLVGHATGVQTYTCNGAGSWGSSVPTADLVDDSGKLIVHHSKGPTWTSTADNSAVLGAKKASAPSPATPPSIDWLLLSTTPVTNAPTGLLTDTTFIQRVNTGGGTAPPTTDCTATTNGKQMPVNYTADYYFWRAAGKPTNPGRPGA